MKRFVSLFLVLVLVMGAVPMLPIHAQSKLFIPVGADGNPFVSPTVRAGDTLVQDVYFKYVGDGSINYSNIVSIDIDTKGGNLSQFPFDPTQSTYLKTYSGLTGMPYYQFNMRCRGDAIPGYYAVDFIVTYSVPDEGSSSGSTSGNNSNSTPDNSSGNTAASSLPPAVPTEPVTGPDQSAANGSAVSGDAVSEPEGQNETTSPESSPSENPDANAGTLSVQTNALSVTGLSAAGQSFTATPLTTSAPQTVLKTEVVTWDVLVTASASAETSTVGSVPKVLITGFSTDPGEVVAGEDFTLTVTFKNTSTSNSIDNLKAVLTSDGTFNPVSGSSTMFIQHLEPGASSTQSITLHTKADASPASYNVSFSMSFDAPGVKDPISDTETVAIPVKQVPKVQITSLQTMGNMTVGSDLNAMTTVNNTGKSVLYNVMVTVYDSGGCLSSEELFLGNIQPGASGNVDVYLSAMMPGMTTLIASVSYEDETGKPYTDEVTLDIELVEEMIWDDPMFMDPTFGVDVTEPERGLPWWVYLIFVAVVGGVAALIILNIVKKRRQRERDLAAARALDEQYLHEDSTV